jgi:hypothetical protein
MKNAKTPTNPLGGGRVRGKVYPHLQKYPGLLKEIRLAYCRMRAQAKFRSESWDLSWEEFQQLWDGQWHLRGREVMSLCLTRHNWSGPWNMDNTHVVTRLEHLRMQGLHSRGRTRTKKVAV